VTPLPPLQQIGAVNDESWVVVDLSDDLSGTDTSVAIGDRAVFRTEKIKGSSSAATSRPARMDHGDRVALPPARSVSDGERPPRPMCV
jgi:hypothetical protein